MPKITLTDLVNLENQTTAVNAINANNAALEAALEKTLSRDGTQPNQMSATLDMNSNQIINLPAPGNPTSPLRLQDVIDGISTTTATTGTSGHSVPFLDGNNTFSGTNTFSAGAYFKSGYPWADVRGYGAKGDWVTDDTSAFQNAAAAMTAIGGGIVYVPPGIYNVNGTIVLQGNVSLIGSGRTSSYIITTSDISIVNASASGQNNIKNIALLGKGSIGLSGSSVDTGSFGATVPVAFMASHGASYQDVVIQGGSCTMQISCLDAIFINIDCSLSYGNTNVYITGNAQNWYYRSKWDHGGQTSMAVTSTMPFSNWTPSTVYSVGQAVITNGYAIQCSVAGTSGATAPTLKNYNVTMTDNTASWVLLAPASYLGLGMDQQCAENHFHMIDLSGPYTFSMACNSTDSLAVFVFTDCVISSPVTIQNGRWVSFNGCEFGDYIDVHQGYPGKFTMVNSWAAASAVQVLIGANVSNFIVSNNHFQGGVIAVSAGTSNHYTITNNVGTTVVDLGTGVNKTVSGNVA